MGSWVAACCSSGSALARAYCCSGGRALPSGIGSKSLSAAFQKVTDVVSQNSVRPTVAFTK